MNKLSYNSPVYFYLTDTPYGPAGTIVDLINHKDLIKYPISNDPIKYPLSNDFIKYLLSPTVIPSAVIPATSFQYQVEPWSLTDEVAKIDSSLSKSQYYFFKQHYSLSNPSPPEHTTTISQITNEVVLASPQELIEDEAKTSPFPNLSYYNNIFKQKYSDMPPLTVEPWGSDQTECKIQVSGMKRPPRISPRKGYTTFDYRDNKLPPLVTGNTIKHGTNCRCDKFTVVQDRELNVEKECKKQFKRSIRIGE